MNSEVNESAVYYNWLYNRIVSVSALLRQRSIYMFRYVLYAPGVVPSDRIHLQEVTKRTRTALLRCFDCGKAHIIICPPTLNSQSQ